MAKMLLVIAVALIVGSLDANAACTQALPACPPLTTNNSAACLDALCNEQAWPNGIVPFGFTNLRPDANIFEAMRAIEEASCGGVLFIHNTSVHGRSLELRRAQRPTGGCVSDGTGAPLADGSRRVIDMDITCLDIIGRGPGGSRRYDETDRKQRGWFLAVLLQALGFHYEHQRPDRDLHVAIQWENVAEESRFEKMRSFPRDMLFGAADGPGAFPYDYDSLMHVRTDRWATDEGMPTMRPLDDAVDDVRLGQRRHLSKGDKERLRALYWCSPIGGTI